MTILRQFIVRSICPGLLVALLLASIVAAATESETDLSEINQVVSVSGGQLDELLGKEIDRIQLFAYRQGLLVPIPLQIDQIDSNGNWVWSEVVKQSPVNNTWEENVDLERELGHRYGRTYDDQDPDNEPVLDSNDLLVFMARDAGNRVANLTDYLANTTTLEIEITGFANGTRGWVYAAYYATGAPPPPSSIRYMQYKPDTRKVISPVYEITFSEEYVGVIEQLAVDGTELLDRTRFRGSLRLGGSRFGKRFSFTENDIEGYMYGYINGPVRVVRRTVAALRFALLLSSPKVPCDQFFYPYHSEIPVRLPVSFIVSSATLLMAADYHNAPFSHAYTSANNIPIPIRGTASEQNLLKDETNVHWVALAGDDASVVSMLTVPEEIRPHISVTPWLLYAPRTLDPPETYPGTEPAAGYLIETRPGIPSGEYLLTGTYLYLPRSFMKGDGRKILGLDNQRLACRVGIPEHLHTVREASHYD